MALPPLFVLAAGAGLLWLNRNRIKVVLAKDSGAVAHDYSPPVEWENVYESAKPAKGSGVYTLVLDKFSDDHQFKRQRSNMPQFHLWYWPYDYMSLSQREGNRGPVEWVETIDGNSRLGGISVKSPVYIQRPFKLVGDIRTRLYLYEIKADQAKRLAEGPPRQEDFTVINYETKQSETLKLNVGSKGGKFRQPVNAKTDAHGTAEPAGLGNMDPALDPHGSAQAGGLGDMHLRS